MIRLHQTAGAHVGRVLEFNQDVVRLGRLPESEVPFDPYKDLDASSRHAEIRREAGQWVLVDVGSRNGTLIAGRRVSRHVLSDGDEVEFGIGGPRLRVQFGMPATAFATESFADPADAFKKPPAGGAIPPFQSKAPGNGLPPGAGNIPAAPLVPAEAAGGIVHNPDLSPDRKYGDRTVGVMIQAALREAGNPPPAAGAPPAGVSPSFPPAASATPGDGPGRSLDPRTLMILGGMMLSLVVGVLATLVMSNRGGADRVREENVQAQQELAALAVDDHSEEAAALEGRVRELNKQLESEHEALSERIASDYQAALFLMLAEGDDGREVMCSAFAVRENLLATSAGCVSAAERQMRRGNTVSLAASRGSSPPISIEHMWRHPAYRPGQSDVRADVGLIQIADEARTTVDLAGMRELRELAPGDDVALFGFPSQALRGNSVRAEVTTGVLGRITDFDGSPDAEPNQQQLLWHSATPRSGTSGSPVFNEEGKAIGVFAVPGVDGRRRAQRRGVAVRIDLILQLLAGMQQR